MQKVHRHLSAICGALFSSPPPLSPLRPFLFLSPHLAPRHPRHFSSPSLRGRRKLSTRDFFFARWKGGGGGLKVPCPTKAHPNISLFLLPPLSFLRVAAEKFPPPPVSPQGKSNRPAHILLLLLLFSLHIQTVLLASPLFRLLMNCANLKHTPCIRRRRRRRRRTLDSIPLDIVRLSQLTPSKKKRRRGKNKNLLLPDTRGFFFRISYFTLTEKRKEPRPTPPPQTIKGDLSEFRRRRKRYFRSRSLSARPTHFFYSSSPGLSRAPRKLSEKSDAFLPPPFLPPHYKAIGQKEAPEEKALFTRFKQNKRG